MGFGRRSKEELETVDHRLRAVLDRVIQFTDFTVLKGRRGKSDQIEAFETGKSKKHWPKSKHNCPMPVDGIEPAQWPEDPNGLSKAVDIAPWPIDWKDERQFALLAGQVIATAREMGIPIRWGRDWDGDGQGVWRDPDESFNDMPHFELVV